MKIDSLAKIINLVKRNPYFIDREDEIQLYHGYKPAKYLLGDRKAGDFPQLVPSGVDVVWCCEVYYNNICLFRESEIIPEGNTENNINWMIERIVNRMIVSLVTFSISHNYILTSKSKS